MDLDSNRQGKWFGPIDKVNAMLADETMLVSPYPISILIDTDGGD